jgi:8-oxo-dGTP pyrophosphatase MutT (NUDIX family)
MTIDLSDATKRDVRTQFGALCWRRRNGEVQVLLVTSRRTRRWIVPKGWPMHGEAPADAAATEAWEEAGVKGRIGEMCIGIYTYAKDIEQSVLPVVVAVFPLKVKDIEIDWPEKNERRRKWFSLKKAAAQVDEPELKALIRNFDPARA